MSMILSLTTVSDRTIARILADPELVWRYLEVEQDDDEAADAPPVEDNEMISMDLDKSWHAIHFLLTGSCWEGNLPLGFILHGGKVLEGVDVGYGPPRMLSSIQVAQVNQALASVPPEELRRRFNPEAMQGGHLPKHLGP
jgi:hypothetical protein